MFPGCTDVSHCRTIEEVMNEANFNWDVDKVPIKTHIDFSKDLDVPSMEVPNYYATIRKDNGKPLGLVKNNYTIVQNKDAFDFFDAAIGAGHAEWQTAGCYGDGNKIFVSAKISESIYVNGEDPVDNYLMFVTSHDGSTGVKVMFTPIRVRCFNMLSAAVKNSSAYLNLRHTVSVHEKLDLAADIMALCYQKTELLRELYNELSKVKFSDKDAVALFANTVLTKEELYRVEKTGHTIEQIAYRDYQAISDSEISIRKTNIISEMNEYYFSGVAQKDIFGTAWGAYNAVSGYYCNVDKATGLSRMDSLMFGDKSRKIEKAANLVLV